MSDNMCWMSDNMYLIIGYLIYVSHGYYTCAALDVWQYVRFSGCGSSTPIMWHLMHISDILYNFLF